MQSASRIACTIRAYICMFQPAFEWQQFQLDTVIASIGPVMIVILQPCHRPCCRARRRLVSAGQTFGLCRTTRQGGYILPDMLECHADMRSGSLRGSDATAECECER